MTSSSSPCNESLQGDDDDVIMHSCTHMLSLAALNLRDLCWLILAQGANDDDVIMRSCNLILSSFTTKVVLVYRYKVVLQLNLLAVKRLMKSGESVSLVAVSSLQ